MSPPGFPKSQARWSISPSTWHDAQDAVPLPDSLASYRNPRPKRITAGVRSVPTAISPDTVFLLVSMIEIVLEIRFKTYSLGPLVLRARPLGPRLFSGSLFEPDPFGRETSTNDNTFPLVSTRATRSVPNEATYMNA